MTIEKLLMALAGSRKGNILDEEGNLSELGETLMSNLCKVLVQQKNWEKTGMPADMLPNSWKAINSGIKELTGMDVDSHPVDEIMDRINKIIDTDGESK